MYIRTENTLVNLADKDIQIRRGYGFGDDPDPYYVLAEGPAAAFDSINESYIRTEIKLFEGTEADCLDYLDGLQDLLSFQYGLEVINGSRESVTGHESPADTVISGNGAAVSLPARPLDDDIPF